MNTNQNVVPIKNHATITILENVVAVKNLKIESPELVDHLRSELDPESAFIELILTALAMKRIAKNTLEMETLTGLAKVVSNTVDSALNDATQGICRAIENASDENNPKGLTSLIKETVKVAVERELSVTNTKSPFHTVNKEILNLITLVSEKAGAKEVSDNSAHKGSAFNLVMDGIFQEIAAQNMDIAEYVNDIPSETGSKVGDEVIYLDSQLTQGKDVRMVSEFKAEDNYSQQKILKELSVAMDNRGAVSGIFVVAKESKNALWAPWSLHSGNRIIVVVEKDKPDKHLIRWAYLYARFLALKTVKSATQDLDLDRIIQLIEDAALKLQDFRNIKSAHTGITKSLDDAKRWTNSIEDELKNYFIEIGQVMKATIN